jgi:hypothetical protein
VIVFSHCMCLHFYRLQLHFGYILVLSQYITLRLLLTLIIMDPVAKLSMVLGVEMLLGNGFYND